MPKTPTRPAQAVNLRRAYFDCRLGQLHCRTAFPNTGGFDERTPLLLVHTSPLSSRTFVPLLAELGADRSMYAIDVPGHGESEPPPAAPTVADYAQAIGDVLDNLRLREVDVLGHGSGSAIVAELAIARPQQVRRVALVGVPLHTAAEREAFERAPWPAPPAEDGSHAVREWQRAIDGRSADTSLAQLAADFAEALRNGANAAWGVRAALQWRGDERIGLVKQPTFVLRPKDALWEPTQRARTRLPQARWKDLPQRGAGLLAIAADELARDLREFYDAA